MIRNCVSHRQLSLAATLLVFGGCGRVPYYRTAAKPMLAANVANVGAGNERVVRGFIENVFNAHDLKAGSTYLRPDFTVTNGFLGVRRGSDAYLKAIGKMSEVFPDLHATVEDAFGNGDRVVLRVTIEGTQRGPLWGIPATGNKLRWTGNNIYRLESGKIVEEWVAEDWLTVFRQLGNFTAPTIK
jgi:steroid delta-isomerase-like uncharacterized protein